MKIKELLKSPKQWTKGQYARNKSGLAIQSTDPEAVCWCIMGAANRCYPSVKNSKLNQNIQHLIGEEIGYNPSVWNDAPERTFEDVHALAEKLDI